MEADAAVSNHIVMPVAKATERSKRDDDSSVPSDSDFDEAWDWRRLYLAADGGFWDLFCCPEDVTSSAECNHQDTSGIDEKHKVCNMH